MIKAILTALVAGIFLISVPTVRAEEKAPAGEKAEKPKKEKAEKADKKKEEKKDEKAAGGW
jgi:ribosomal protein L12E/L44/L45/RPP1/RPP2